MNELDTATTIRLRQPVVDFSANVPRVRPMDPPSKPPVYRFGTFRLDSRTGEISSNGTKTQLREQPFQLLLALLEKPSELVTREDLVRRLWPAGTFVDYD